MNKKYQITLINSEYGQILNSEGKLYLKGTDPFYPRFEKIEEAKQERDRLLKKYVYAGVIITNLESKETSKIYFNTEIGPLYHEEQEKYNKWLYSFWRRYFTQKPKMKYYKPEQR